VLRKEGILCQKKRANGEGNIRKCKDGRWEGRYTAGYDPATGKRIIKNVLGKTQAEVKEKLKQALEVVEQTDIIRAEDYTVASWLTTWYTLYAKPNVRVSTAEYYRRNIKLHVNPSIGNIKLANLGTDNFYPAKSKNKAQKKWRFYEPSHVENGWMSYPDASSRFHFFL